MRRTAGGNRTAYLDKGQIVEYGNGLILYTVNGKQVYNTRVRIRNDGSVSQASMKALKALLR